MKNYEQNRHRHYDNYRDKCKFYYKFSWRNEISPMKNPTISMRQIRSYIFARSSITLLLLTSSSIYTEIRKEYRAKNPRAKSSGFFFFVPHQIFLRQCKMKSFQKSCYWLIRREHVQSPRSIIADARHCVTVHVKVASRASG